MGVSDRAAPLIRLEGTQKLASDPRELIWLSASAGTGKTQVLSSRVLRLLLGGARPETILCLTFTRAGAAEMANRIQATLARWVRLKSAELGAQLVALGEAPTPENIAFARTLFAEVLDSPGGGLRIQTIHAFCQTLLAGFPAEAGLAPGFRPLEGREEAALARRTLAELLDGAERGGDLGLIAAVETLSRRLGEGGAETYLMRCARDPDAMEALGPGIAPKVRRALDVPAGDIEEAITAACADESFDTHALRAVSAANAGWGTATGLAAADRCAAFLAAAPATRATMLDALASVVLTAKGTPRAISTKLLAVEPDYAGHAERLAAACTALLGLRQRAELARLLSAGLRGGQAYARAYTDAKRTAGVLDFDDLIRHTARLLETPGMGDWVRYKLDRSTDHVLVDEAQDTNLRQWTIIASLASEFFAGEGARGGVIRTLFTVGDFKQAIFGFQGTDPNAFLAAGLSFTRRAGEAERVMHRLSLDRSFRSTPPVLELVDGLIAELGAERLGLGEAVNRHVSAKAHLPGRVTLWRPIVAGLGADDDEDAEEGWIDDATRAFATRLARQIREWLDDPFRIEGKGRPLRPEDILILVRRRGELASLLVARLHEEGVPVAGVDRLRLTAPLAVRDLLAAIRFALQPDDDLSLAGLLVSPLFGLSQDDLYAIGFGRKTSLWTALRRAAGYEAVAAGLGLILARADFTTPYQFLETMLTGPLDGRRKLLARLGEEARDPIEELLNAALQFEAAETPSLQRFLDWFDRGDVDITRDASAPLDAVRVMTVHGAKGLQAPVVILADATGDPDNSRTSSLDWAIEEELRVPVFRPRKEELAGSLADDLASAEGRERAEHWRLLYVAATRAEERLFVGGALGPRARGEPAADSWYQTIDKALATLGAEWEEDPLWSGARHHHGIAPVAAGQASARAAPAALPVPVLPEWLFQAAPKEARPSRPLAPSALGIDAVADPPPSPAMLDAARRGRLLHALFERLPALPPEGREAAALRWLEQAAGVDDAGLRADLVAAACAIIADPRFADIFGPDALAEAPIAAVVGEDVIAGTVDRLLVTDTLVRVVDFKTGRRVPPSVEAMPEHHVRQMAAYVAALEIVFPGRIIEAGLLYTAGPSLLTLPAALIAHYKKDLAGQQQILPLAR